MIHIHETKQMLDDVKVGQLITELALIARLEQSDLHFGRREKRCRNWQAKNATKAPQ